MKYKFNKASRWWATECSARGIVQAFCMKDKAVAHTKMLNKEYQPEFCKHKTIEVKITKIR